MSQACPSPAPDAPPDARRAPFHVMAKPAGPACNLRCGYCHDLEKKDLFDGAAGARMDEATLEAFVRDYIGAQDAPEIAFAWQGGEPMLRGLDFFRKVVELQRRYADGRVVTNALQTNGTLIDEEWAAFLAEHGFLVRLGIDGPPELHDAYRVDAAGRSTSMQVLEGLALLQAAGVEFNTLTVVSALNARHPLEVYRYLKDIGSRHIQFIPLVERRPRQQPGAALAGPPVPGRLREAEFMKWSVGSVAYGRFLTTVFGEWVRRDVGRVFVPLFDSTLHTWLEGRATLCTFSETCGRQLALEHDGSVYACDHYAYPDWQVGKLGEQSLPEILASPALRAFGDAKRDTLASQCRRCDVLAACRGGCPKHRFLHAASGGPGVNYLCAGLRQFFRTVAPHMRAMAWLVRQGRPASDIMRPAPRGL